MLTNIPTHSSPIKASSKVLIYEDAQCIVYDETDENVKHREPMHFSIVPKKPISMAKGSANDEKHLGHLLIVAKKIAMRNGFHRSGYHVKITEDPNSTQVLSLHIANKILQPVLWPIAPNSRL